MGVWAAGIGPSITETALRAVLGAGATIHAGNGFALGVAKENGGEPARLLVAPPGATITLGNPHEAGSQASFDTATGALTLACDPFGLHGIWYARGTNDVFWCASDPRLLRRVVPPPGGPGSDWDLAALHGYLCFGYVPAPRTLFTGIARLPLGSSSSSPDPPFVMPARPPMLPPTPPSLGEEDSVGQKPAARQAHSPPPRVGGLQLGCLLQRAVEARFAGDGEREVGVFLSGGLDSSLVAALLAKAGARLHLFTLDFGPPHNAEIPWARGVAMHLDQPLHIVRADPNQVRAALDETARALPQPFGDGVVGPLFLLGAAARKHVSVVWNGEGGDQLWGGWANKPMVAATVYGGGQTDEVALYLETFHRFHGLESRLYTPALRNATRTVDAADWIRPALANKGDDLLHRLRRANLALKGAQNIAPRCVALAQCHGLRVRAPFFDTTLAAWADALPSSALLSGACEKYLLKRAAEPFLPAEIVWREKRGMGVPLSDWCLNEGPMRREVLRRLSPRRVKHDGWFEPHFVASLLRGDDPTPGGFRRRRVGEKLWTLLMLSVWKDVCAR